MTDRLTDEQLRKMASWNTQPECLSWMAEEIAALRAENERLRGYVDRWTHANGDCDCIMCEEARAALSGETAETKK